MAIYRGEHIAKDNRNYKELAFMLMVPRTSNVTSGLTKKPFLGAWRMFLEDLHLQLHGAGRDFHRLRGLVASALFQTDLLPS